MMNAHLERYKNKLIDFRKNTERLYIYGAGNFGKGYLDILRRYGYDADGFIVTEKQADEFLDKPVCSVAEMCEMISEWDGVIPAFTNSDRKEIESRFTKAKPRILDFDHKIMLCLENELHFFPLIERLDREFPELEKVIDRSEWNHILIVRLDAIGDTVFTTPFIRELRRNVPESRISVVIRKQNGKLLEDCPYIDELFLYESGLVDGELAEQCRKGSERLSKVLNFVNKSFLGKKFDAVFFPRELLSGRNTIEELLIAYYSRARFRIGRMLVDGPDKQLICEKLRDSFTLISNPAKPMHEAAYALDMLRQCGCKVEDERMELWPSSRSEERAAQLFDEHGIKENQFVIALGIVASVDTRTWKIENYNQVIRHYGEMFQDAVRFVVLGGSDAQKAAVRLNDSYGNIINLVGKTNLNETAACMKHCTLYVGSNTGLLHFASAFGVPSVTIYSELSDGEPTDGDSPFRMGAWKVPHIDLVPPAGLDGCHGACRMGFSHCVNLITPEQVIDAVSQMLGLA